MRKMVGLGGSLRRASLNRALLGEAGKALPEGWAWEIADYRSFPLYDADVDAQGTPEAVAACKDQVAGADALFGLELALHKRNESKFKDKCK